MQRVYNFSAGPSMLPVEVLQEAGEQAVSANGAGQSVMEMSHRSKDFAVIIEEAGCLLREIMNIPPGYDVLFLQGGATLQFSMLPINLAGVEEGAPKKQACYIDTGVWAAKAAEEAGKYVNVRVAASSKNKNYAYIPKAPPPEKDDAYYHICLNNTIVGTRWHALPETGSTPLVADASSFILSEPLDVSRFALVYAGAQKNLGPAGCTIVIVKNGALIKAPSWTPVMLRYDVHAKEKSLFNTPPCWSIYISGLVLKWILKQGGLKAVSARNAEKAEMLYDAIESSAAFRPLVQKEFRSLMNVTFASSESDAVKKEACEKRFLKEAGESGLINLAGHRIVGGLRASIYNAMPAEGVAALSSFIKKFDPKKC